MEIAAEVGICPTRTVRHYILEVLHEGHLLPPDSSEMRIHPNFTDLPIHGHSSLADPLPQGSPLWQDASVLPPGSIEEFHLCQPLCYHGGKNQAKKDTAD